MQTIKSTKQQSWLIDMIGLGIAFVAFYSLWLGSHPLFLPDEGRYSLVASEMIAAHDFITPRLNGVTFLDKPILFYWLQATAMQIFGTNEWALRLFPALLGVMGCFVTYICGRQLFDRRTALLSSIILAASPLYFGSAHYANLDLEVAVFISCSLLFFLTGVQSQGRARFTFLMCAYACAGLAFLTKGLIGIVFPSVISLIWMATLHRWHEMKKIYLLPGSLLFLAIAAPWYILVQQANPGFLHFFFITQHFSRFLSIQAFNNPLPAWFYLPVVLTGIFPWIAFLIQALTFNLQQIWQNKQAHANQLFLLLWVGVIFTFFSIPHSKLIGYILPIFPAIALLIGHYFSSRWEQGSLFGNLLFILLCLFTAFFLIMAEQHAWFELIANIKSHVYIVGTLLVISAIAALFLLKQKSLLPLFVLCALTSSTILITILNRADDINQTSAKPLITQLISIKQPGDEVVNYFKFYHDVPLFLGQPITLVANWEDPQIATRDNWVRELWLGMPEQKTNDLLITEPTFWQRFNSSKRLFVFLNSNYFDQFKKHAAHYYILGQHNDIILVSNKI